MAFVQPVLYAEGTTDYRLLGPLLRRLVEEVCLASAHGIVDVADVQGIDEPTRFRREDRATRILEAARGFWGDCCVLFIHADGAGEPELKKAEQIDPGMRLVKASLKGGACVPVVPVRELEAWALADGDALRDAFGTTLGDDALGLPRRARDIEGVLDPKKTLRSAFEASIGAARRRRAKESDYYSRIGERLDLPTLRQVSAFARVEIDLRAALQAMGILRDA